MAGGRPTNGGGPQEIDPGPMTAPPDSSKQISTSKKLLFSLILGLVAFGVLEFASVVYLKYTRGYDGEHFLHYRYDSYKNLHPAPGYVDTRGVSHNDQGFRHPTEVVREKPEGVYRIFLMGGSTAYGSGTQWSFIQRDFEVIRDDETISYYLDGFLRSALPDARIELINAAIPTVWTHHHLIYLNQTILGFDPDMIIFLDGNNDHFHYAEGHDQFEGYLYTNKARVIMGDPTLRALFSANGWWLFRRSAFLHVTFEGARSFGWFVRSIVRPPPKPDPVDEERALVQLRATFEANALRMIERNGRLVRGEGVRPVFMLQPLLILEGERRLIMTPIEQEMFDFMVESSLPGWEAWVKRAAPLVSGMVAETAERVGGTFLDLTEIYAGRTEQMYTDYCHLTPMGNRVLAEAAAAHLVPLIREDLEAIRPGDAPASVGVGRDLERDGALAAGVPSRR
jgi:hypothetical protein